MKDLRSGEVSKSAAIANSCVVVDSNPRLGSESMLLAVSGGSEGGSPRARIKRTFLVSVGVLTLGLCVSGVLYFMLRQMAILRLETELLQLRLQEIEGHVERCNALLQTSSMLAGWRDDADDVIQRPAVSSGPSLSLSSSSSSSKNNESSSSSLLQQARMKRNAEKKNNNKKTSPKPKPPKSHTRVFAASFETDQPLLCEQTSCTSLTGWKPSSWVHSSVHHLYNELSGQLEIPDDGIYYVYAQVTYRTVSALEAFAIMIDRHDQLAKCLTGVDYVKPDADFAANAQSKTCHTGAVVHLRQGQKVWLKSLHMGDTVSVLSVRHTSFWGVLRIK